MKVKYIQQNFDIKAISDEGIFEGYGSTHDLDQVRDVVMPGAFEKSLSSWSSKGKMPPVLWQHRTDSPIGVYSELKEDDKGLLVKGNLLVGKVQLATEAYELIKAGAVSGLSIGYVPVVEEYNREEKINYLKEVNLFEVSLVTMPCNEAAQVTAVKSIKTVRDFEKFLRDSGFSRAEAIEIASKGFQRRESVSPEELARIIQQTTAILEV